MAATAVGDFTGSWHHQGDTLITSSFTGGGIVSTILVFEWCSTRHRRTSSAVTATALQCRIPEMATAAVADLAGADAAVQTGHSANASSLACATVNRSINTYCRGPRGAGSL
jgi:hypothetical protein